MAPFRVQSGPMMIEPISASQCDIVLTTTSACVKRAGTLLQRDFPEIDVRFDLTGRAAGMYRVQRGQRVIRYNPYIFAKYFTDGLNQTVPHEVAHYVTDMLFGLRTIRPHGREWQAVMRTLGAEPRARGCYDLTGVPMRRQRRFSYRCACVGDHQLSTRRHNAIRRGEVRYLCKRCGTALVNSEEEWKGTEERG